MFDVVASLPVANCCVLQQVSKLSSCPAALMTHPEMKRLEYSEFLLFIINYYSYYQWAIGRPNHYPKHNMQ